MVVINCPLHVMEKVRSQKSPKYRDNPVFPGKNVLSFLMVAPRIWGFSLFLRPESRSIRPVKPSYAETACLKFNPGLAPLKLFT
jgi:hypothetical protein